MNRSHRLTGLSEFKRVRRTGKSHAHPLIVLVASRNQLPTSRFGVAAGKAVGGAVQRNRAKRRLRAALRGQVAHVAAGWDVILIARAPMAEAAWPSVAQALSGLLHRAGLVPEPEAGDE